MRNTTAHCLDVCLGNCAVTREINTLMDFDNNSMLGEFKWHKEKSEAFSLDLVANMHMPNLLAELKKEKNKKT